MENLPIQILLAEDKVQFRQEQSNLLKTILNYRFFNPWKNITASNGQYSLQNDANVELYITNKCNQKCEYCYLQKYPQLYPEANEETILHNLQLFYDYCITNNFYIPEIDMFSGEIWHTEFGLKILEMTLTATHFGLNFDHILISSNCSFANDPVALQKIQYYIDEFNRIQKPIIFSISVDGKVIDEKMRPRNNGTKYTDDYYDNLFAFAKHNGYYFHPMVSAHSIKYWKENFDWWEKMHQYYDLPLHQIMLLEVRNDEWTDEAIKDYCDFIVYVADNFLRTACKGDTHLMANLVANIRTETIQPPFHGYVPWAITSTDTFLGCTSTTHLTVRLGDLAICPCHRTAYNKYLYGKFVVEDDAIVDIEAQNPQMAIKVLMGNTLTAYPKCDTCLYKNTCLKGCLGAQLEATKDPFFPIESVCKLYKAKYSTILKYYKDKGFIDYYKTFSVQELGVKRVIEIVQLYEAWEAQNNGME